MNHLKPAVCEGADTGSGRCAPAAPRASGDDVAEEGNFCTSSDRWSDPRRRQATAASPLDAHRRSVVAALFTGAGLSLLGATSLSRRAAAAPDDMIRLRELYEKDFSFSDLARSMAGRRVAISGYMAPPLKAESDFFVLTKQPMATCPFCESEADWPRDILAVYTRRQVTVLPFNVGIVASGILELGSHRDESTGFLSRVRLTRATVERV